MIILFIVKTKKEIINGLLISVLGISLGLGISFMSFSSAFEKKDSKDLVVVIDAGHGIPDGGAVGINGTVEEKINLEISQKICEVLEAKGIKVVMTRVTNNCLVENTSGKTIRRIKVEDMHKRLDIIKKSNADIFVSIHMNYYTDNSVDGLRLFYDKKHEETKELTQYLQSRMAEITNNKIYAVKATDSSLFLMNKSPVPAILIECGFLSNATDEKNLNNDEYQSKIAWAIATGIEKYYTKAQ